MPKYYPNTTITNYPFGMLMPGRTYSSEAYSWGFNGMQKDDEISGSGNNLDFGARIYDSRLGRFLSIDPLKSNFAFMTGYSFAMNTPIRYIDKNGESIFDDMKVFFSRSWNKITKGTFETNYEIAQRMRNQVHEKVLENLKNYSEYNDDLSVLNGLPQSCMSESYLKGVAENIVPSVTEFRATIKHWKRDEVEQFEDFLNGKSKDNEIASIKVGLAFLYDIVNSPYVALTGHTLGGEQKTPYEAIEALTTSLPILTGIKAGTNLLTGKNNSYTNFKTNTKGVFTGDDKKHIKKSFHLHKESVQSISDSDKALDKFLEGIDAGQPFKKEFNEKLEKNEE